MQTFRPSAIPSALLRAHVHFASDVALIFHGIMLSAGVNVLALHEYGVQIGSQGGLAICKNLGHRGFCDLGQHSRQVLLVSDSGHLGQ